MILREKDPVSKPGHYEFLIDPGEYVIIAIKDGYEESREEMIASKGENQITCAINPLNQNIPLKSLIGASAQAIQQRDEDGGHSNKHSDKRLERPGEKGYSKSHSQTREHAPSHDTHKDQIQKKERVQSGRLTAL